MPYKDKKKRDEKCRRWQAKNVEKVKEIKRRSQKKNWKSIKVKRKIMNAVPEAKRKRLAEYRFRFAVKKGWVTRPKGMHFHHVDYDKPYLGCWVTPKEHRGIHAGLIPCPAARDYTQPVLAERAYEKRNRRGAIAANRKRWE